MLALKIPQVLGKVKIHLRVLCGIYYVVISSGAGTFYSGVRDCGMQFPALRPLKAVEEATRSQQPL